MTFLFFEKLKYTYKQSAWTSHVCVFFFFFMRCAFHPVIVSYPSPCCLMNRVIHCVQSWSRETFYAYLALSGSMRHWTLNSPAVVTSDRGGTFWMFFLAISSLRRKYGVAFRNRWRRLSAFDRYSLLDHLSIRCIQHILAARSPPLYT